jgi:hypothetical protein
MMSISARQTPGGKVRRYSSYLELPRPMEVSFSMPPDFLGGHMGQHSMGLPCYEES